MSKKMPRTKKTLLEKDIETQIFAYLRKQGILVFKVVNNGYFDPVRKLFRRQQSPFFRKGCSDIIGLLPNGRFLAIEVKSATGRVSEEQKSFLKDVSESGGLSFVARSVDEVKAQLWLDRIIMP